MLQTAKIFTNGRSQAVRLPLEYRFDTAEVFIRRNPISGDVILSKKPNEWQGLIDAVMQNSDDELLETRARTKQRRDPFEA
jgi:antitoxin VapB